MNAPATTTSGPALTISRVFDAPRELVFACWTQEKHMRQWCFPKGFTVPQKSADIRPGGAFRTCLRAPEGIDHWVRGTYVELAPPERIVFSHAWEDETGNATHETVVTITLAEAGPQKTLLTLHQAFFLTESSRDGHSGGWNETLDSLQEYLSR